MFYSAPSSVPGRPGCWFIVVNTLLDPEVSRFVLFAMASGVFPRIVFTHDGRAHNDEIGGCASFCLDEAFLIIVRTRKEDFEWEIADHLLDIGGRYDGGKYLDHHQRKGKPRARDNGVHYAAFCLALRRKLPWVKKIADIHGVFHDKLAIALDKSFEGFDFHDTGRTLDSSILTAEEARSAYEPKDPDPMKLISGQVNAEHLLPEERNDVFAEAVRWMTRAIISKAHECAVSLKFPLMLDAGWKEAADRRIVKVGCRPRNLQSLIAERRYKEIQRIIYEDIGSIRVLVVKRSAKTIPFPEQWENDPPPGLAYLRDDRLYLAADSLEDAYALAALSLEVPFELTPPEHSLAPSSDEDEEVFSYADPNQYEVFSAPSG